MSINREMGHYFAVTTLWDPVLPSGMGSFASLLPGVGAGLLWGSLEANHILAEHWRAQPGDRKRDGILQGGDYKARDLVSQGTGLPTTALNTHPTHGAESPGPQARASPAGCCTGQPGGGRRRRGPASLPARAWERAWHGRHPPLILTC